MQPASFCCLFLINPLLLAYAADRAAKTNADVERHCCHLRSCAADAYTPDESHCCRLLACAGVRKQFRFSESLEGNAYVSILSCAQSAFRCPAAICDGCGIGSNHRRTQAAC